MAPEVLWTTNARISIVQCTRLYANTPSTGLSACSSRDVFDGGVGASPQLAGGAQEGQLDTEGSLPSESQVTVKEVD